MITRQKALALRALLEKAATSLSDEDALKGIELFPQWKVNTEYFVKDRVRYNGVLYRCEQSHTSQETWQPSQTPALWTEVAEPGEIPVWKQPTGVQDAYMTGDKVYYPDNTGLIYISVVDYNTWEPGVYGWEEV